MELFSKTNNVPSTVNSLAGYSPVNKPVAYAHFTTGNYFQRSRTRGIAEKFYVKQDASGFVLQWSENCITITYYNIQLSKLY